MEDSIEEDREVARSIRCRPDKTIGPLASSQPGKSTSRVARKGDDCTEEKMMDESAAVIVRGSDLGRQY
jgi:hypothetical protein